MYPQTITLINKKGGGDFMNWEDMTCKFRTELESAINQKVFYGDTQPVVDIIEKIQKESFEEGCRYMADLLQYTIEEKVMINETKKEL